MRWRRLARIGRRRRRDADRRVEHKRPAVARGEIMVTRSRRTRAGGRRTWHVEGHGSHTTSTRVTICSKCFFGPRCPIRLESMNSIHSPIFAERSLEACYRPTTRWHEVTSCCRVAIPKQQHAAHKRENIHFVNREYVYIYWEGGGGDACATRYHMKP